MTDDDIERIAPLPENQNYIDFLLEVAERGDENEMIMAVLPCMLSYIYIFRKLAVQPDCKQSRYWDFIKDYANDIYAENCREWCSFASRKCEKLSKLQKDSLSKIFEKASLLELDFWNMAYREVDK